MVAAPSVVDPWIADVEDDKNGEGILLRLQVGCIVGYNDGTEDLVDSNAEETALGLGYGRSRGRSHGRGRGRGYGRGHEQFGRGIPQEPRKRIREDNYFKGPTNEYDHRGGRY